jgi:VIT1/CCC1 family predicted Fe2+/Mn2+ transporter
MFRSAGNEMLSSGMTALSGIDEGSAAEIRARLHRWGVGCSALDALDAKLSRPDVVARQAERGDIEEVSPWRAASVLAAAFTVGALLPFPAILLVPNGIRVPVTVAAVLAALSMTSAAGAALGGARRGRATIRVLIGGVIALATTYTAGVLLGARSL